MELVELSGEDQTHYGQIQSPIYSKSGNHMTQGLQQGQKAEVGSSGRSELPETNGIH